MLKRIIVEIHDNGTIEAIFEGKFKMSELLVAAKALELRAVEEIKKDWKKGDAEDAKNV